MGHLVAVFECIATMEPAVQLIEFKLEDGTKSAPLKELSARATKWFLRRLGEAESQWMFVFHHANVTFWILANAHGLWLFAQLFSQLVNWPTF